MHIYNNTYIYIYIHDLNHMIYTYSTNLHIIYMFLSRVWITNMNFFRVHVHTNTHTHIQTLTHVTHADSPLYHVWRTLGRMRPLPEVEQDILKINYTQTI